MTQSSNRQGYLVTNKSGDDTEFSFVTDFGVEYIVYFLEADGYVQSASFASDFKMFGFGPVDKSRPEGKLPKDDNVVVTIFEIVYYYMSKYPERILTLVCSDESIWKPGPDNKNSRYAKFRNDLFARWYEDWQKAGVMPAEKIDCNLYGLFCSCLYLPGNPSKLELNEIINRMKAEKYS